MRALSLAVRGFTREWRSGELGVLLLALTIAVAALTGVGFLVERIGIAVAQQATQVLAADLRLESPRPIGAADFEEATRRGVRSARTVSMLSVVFLGDASELSDLHAVTAGYPLRGTLKVGAAPFAKGSPADGIPGRGEAWPSSKLLATLGGHVGSVLSIGAASFRVTRVLISRPGEGGTFADLAPSIVLNAADLPATRLIQPGSRVTYAALFSADRARIMDFRGWLAAHRRPGEHLRDIAETSPQIKGAG
ncbi:MAG: ABC transporter permease, partial [Steroidobacteraceae bacterium]